MKKSSVYRNKTIDRLAIKSDYLGKKYNIILLLNIRFIICLLIFVVFALIHYTGFILGPLVAVIVYYLLEYFFFDVRIVRRKKQLEKDGIVFFNLLNICLKSNKSIYNSLEIVSNNLDSMLAKEFRCVLKDSNYGKDLADTLNGLKKRIPSDTINNFILAIVEANNNVSSLENSLDIQLNHLKGNVLDRAKAKINLIPIKMNLISILFLVILSSLIYYLVYLLKIA